MGNSFFCVYFQPSQITFQIAIEKARMLCVGFETRAAGWQAHTDSLSYGGFHLHSHFVAVYCNHLKSKRPTTFSYLCPQTEMILSAKRTRSNLKLSRSFHIDVLLSNASIQAPGELVARVHRGYILIGLKVFLSHFLLH